MKKKNSSTKDINTNQNSFETVEVRQQLVDDVQFSTRSECEINFKVVVIGQSFVGKTSLIKRFIGGNFISDYNVTVGAEFATKIVTLQDGKSVKLNIWDTCGHDIFRSMTSSFYRGSSAAFLIFSISNKKSFEKMESWYNQFADHASPHACIFLIGTKVDTQRQVSSEKAMELLKKIKGHLYFETSAQTGENIQQGFLSATQTMYKLYRTSPQFRAISNPLKAHGSFLLSCQADNYKENGKPKKKCC